MATVPFSTIHNSRLISLVNHCLGAIHCTFELTDNPVAPEGATLLGVTDVVQVGCAVLRIRRSQTTLWTGYWDASGN